MHVNVHITQIMRFDDVTIFTQAYYDLFVKVAQWEANYGNDIFWAPWLVLSQLHSSVLVLKNGY